MRIIPVQFSPKRPAHGSGSDSSAKIVMIDGYFSGTPVRTSIREALGVVLPWTSGRDDDEESAGSSDRGNLIYFPSPDFPPSAA